MMQIHRQFAESIDTLMTHHSEFTQNNNIIIQIYTNLHHRKFDRNPVLIKHCQGMRKRSPQVQ